VKTATVKLDRAFVERLARRLMARGLSSVDPPRMADPAEARASLARSRPFAEAMFLMMTADGEMADVEREVLMGAIRALSGGQLGPSASAALMSEFQAALARDGLEVRLDDVASRLYAEAEDRELVLALVAAVASADLSILDSERRVLFGLAERLGVSKKEVAALVGEEPGGH